MVVMVNPRLVLVRAAMGNVMVSAMSVTSGRSYLWQPPRAIRASLTTTLVNFVVTQSPLTDPAVVMSKSQAPSLA